MAQFSPLLCTCCFTCKQQVQGSITPFTQAEGTTSTWSNAEWVPDCSCNSSRAKEKHGTFLLCATEKLLPRGKGVQNSCCTAHSPSMPEDIPCPWGHRAAVHPLGLIPPPPLQRYKASRLRTNSLSRHQWTFGTANTYNGKSMGLD